MKRKKLHALDKCRDFPLLSKVDYETLVMWDYEIISYLSMNPKSELNDEEVGNLPVSVLWYLDLYSTDDLLVVYK